MEARHIRHGRIWALARDRRMVNRVQVRRVASFPVVWFGPSRGKGSRVLVRGTHFNVVWPHSPSCGSGPPVARGLESWCGELISSPAATSASADPPSIFAAGSRPSATPPPPPSTSPATSVLRTGDSEPSPVHAVPEWENLKSSPSGGGLGGIDFGSLERNLSHICKQTSAAGRCVEVHTSRTQFPPSGPNPNSVPLRGAERNWSTLGGILDPLLRL
jgi:hypothetical protein